MTPEHDARRELTETMALAYRDFEKGLNKHSYFKVSDHDLSEDLVQETYMKTWRYLVRGGKIELMRAFLYHTLNCLITDEYRKKKASSLDSLLEKGFDPTGVNPTDTIIDALDGKTAILLIAQLPENYQSIMRMRYAQGLSYAEISEITGQTKNAIAVQMHRGLAKLKVLYTHES